MTGRAMMTRSWTMTTRACQAWGHTASYALTITDEERWSKNHGWASSVSSRL